MLKKLSISERFYFEERHLCSAFPLNYTFGYI